MIGLGNAFGGGNLGGGVFSRVRSPLPGLAPLLDFDLGAGRFSDVDGLIPAGLGDRVALQTGFGGTMSEHDAGQGMIARDGYLEGDGATTAMILDGMGPALLGGGHLVIYDIQPVDFNNRVITTLDNAAEVARARWFLTGGDRLRLDLNGASTDVTIGALSGQRFTLAMAFADDLVSVWIDGVLAAENVPFALSSLTIPTPRAVIGADINGATDERFEFNGGLFRIAIRVLT